jgi:hypothetical protein
LDEIKQVFLYLHSVFKPLANLAVYNLNAWMAELVDALVSGTSIRKDVQVRVLFQAHLLPDDRDPKCEKHFYLLKAQVVELVDTPA